MLEEFQEINLESEIEQSLYDTRENYVSLQQDQMLSGKRSDDKNIFRLSTGSDEYSPAYAKRKGKSKPIDLEDKGDFHGEIFMDVRDEELFIDSADPKSGMLQKEYGEEIFGLNDKRGTTFAENTGEALVKKVTDKLS